MASEVHKFTVPPRVLIEIEGAAGNVYRIRDWCPVALFSAIAELITEETRMQRGAEGRPWEEVAAEWETHLARARELAVAVIANGSETPNPDLTWDDIAADFPEDGAARMLGFFFARQRAKAMIANPGQMEMLATIGRALEAAKDSAVTPMPRNRAERRRKTATTG